MPLVFGVGIAASLAVIGVSLYLVGAHRDLARWLKRNQRPGLYGDGWGPR